MKARLVFHLVTTYVWLCVGGSPGSAAVSPLTSPGDISGGTTIGFDGIPNNTIVNTRYQGQGITLTRDDGQAVFASDYVAIGRTTSSPRNVLSTIYVPGVNTTYSTHLNVISTSPLFAIGAFWGNDRGDPDFTSIRMSVFGLTGELLGSVNVAGNGIRSADQYIGLSSDVPFTHIRFDNLNASGGQSTFFALALDDLKFTTVPEPASIALLSLGLLGLFLVRSRRSNRR